MAQLAERQARSERPDNPGELSRADYYGLIRSQIDGENQLSTQRVIWLLIAEAFFISGYATLLNAPPEAKNAVLEFQRHLLLWVLPLAALIAGVLAFFGVFASMSRIQLLQGYYESYDRDSEDRDESTLYYPPLQDGDKVYLYSRLSMLGLTIVFILLWMIIVGSQAVRTLMG